VLYTVLDQHADEARPEIRLECEGAGLWELVDPLVGLEGAQLIGVDLPGAPEDTPLIAHRLNTLVPMVTKDHLQHVGVGHRLRVVVVSEAAEAAACHLRRDSDAPLLPRLVVSVVRCLAEYDARQVARNDL